jgi:glycosyltransferase involved in cell wall biosynthesis
VRVCIVYDCLYPYTIGGAERWYRNLAERLASSGHEVTFLTRRQWGRDEDPTVAGVRVIAVSPRTELYADGRRRILPPVLFGLGVLRHLLRHGDDYDIVHTASFPYFSLLAAGIGRNRGRFRLLVDWLEVWTPDYWREYLGPLRGRIGWLIQRTCLRIPQRAICFSRLHERRLREEGFTGELTRLEGLYAGSTETTQRAAEPIVVFAGRHIPEKRVPSVVPAIAEARKRVPELRGAIYGDGPERPKVLRAIADRGLEDVISVPGFVTESELEDALATALCLVLPSRREGYGLVVIEAAAHGVPTVAVAGPDNAAVELIEEETNGAIADSDSPQDLSAAILRIHDGGATLRHAAAAWFRANAQRLSFESSFQVVLEIYGGP